MDERYNQAPNDSPRSGTKNLTPAIWGVIAALLVVAVIWFQFRL